MSLEFTLDINDQILHTTEDYEVFIGVLRTKLADRYCHHRPVLPVQESFPPTRFFNLIIQYRNRYVRFRFRMDNLYLVGYQMENGQWLEFDNDLKTQTHLIQGSQFLGFRSGYEHIAEAAHSSVERVWLGFRNLESAISYLATATDTMSRAYYLIIVIMMICESTRFNPVYHYILQGRDDFQVPTWMANFTRSWEDLSAALLRTEYFPEERFVIRENNLVLPNGQVVTTIQEVIRILGILLGICFDISGPTRLLRTTFDDEGQCFLGLPLVQVFTVRINNIDNKNPGDLYGTITISNGLYTQYIYNRTSDNYESIKPGENASLIGPSYTLTAFGNVTIKLLLTDQDTWDLHQNISWNAFDIGRVYDQLIAKTLDNSRGSVTVNYAVLRNAVAARVTVSVEEEGKDRTEVYGKVSAHYDKCEDPETTCLLFNRTSSDSVDVRRWQTIPLLRSAIAVPMANSLKVTASLYDNDLISADDLIASGTVEFPIPENIPDTSFKNIQGKDGNWVKVTVYWTSGF